MGRLNPWGLILGVWGCLMESRIAVVSPPVVFNLLANAALESGVATENLPVPQWLSLVGATESAPIVIATPVPHGFATGDTVVIKGVAGNTDANGYWKVSVLTPTTFSLDGSSGRRAYEGGGACYPTLGQPAPPGRGNSSNELSWTPWYSNPAFFTPGEFFVSDGSKGSGEVSTRPPVPGDSFLSQDIDGSRFRPGEHLCLSLYARMPVPAVAKQSLKMLVTAVLGAVTTYSETFNAAAMTEEYGRFALHFVLPENAVTMGGTVRVEFLNEALTGPTRTMLWTRPMLNEGDEPAPWTPAVETPPRAPRTVDFR